jgi:maltose phosphorylase
MAKVADQYFTVDPWQVQEEGFDPNHARVAESIFSIANEYSGVRGYFEEGYSGDHLLGSYFNGVYENNPEDHSIIYAGISRQGHFMVNATDWLFTRIKVDDEQLDLATSDVDRFSRVLDFRNGVLERQFVWRTRTGKELQCTFSRFVSMTEAASCYQRITLTPLNFAGEINITSGLDFDTRHGNSEKSFWRMTKQENQGNSFAGLGQTIHTNKRICSRATILGLPVEDGKPITDRNRFVGTQYNVTCEAGQTLALTKLVTNTVERDPAVADAQLWSQNETAHAAQVAMGWDTALAKQKQFWQAFWAAHDIEIDGDPQNQQGIRYCMFEMAQTYHGEDPANNIGAKGLTGEAYGGLAFWDTETMCLPFYLFNDIQAAKNLLEFRYRTLPQAKERAEMVDCRGASYPISTINGHESTAMWQHANTQLQPSTAVAYAIWHYGHLTEDHDFLYTHGIEMLVEISRFLYSRGDWSQVTHQFSFYGVMGPDEFQVMANHNAYTNYMARETFRYTIQLLSGMRENVPALAEQVVQKTGVSADELAAWQKASDHMVFLGDNNGMIEQQAGFYDLPHVDIDQIPVSDFPLYDHWSYDRLFRNDMIKQPDVLMLQFLYNHQFTERSKRLNYEYYEPRTIHESSLSPSVHSILAEELHKFDDAYKFFQFATRMDLDNYNRNTRDGLHTTSIAAAWLNIVYGFGGLRSDGPTLTLAPSIPKQWHQYSFKITYRRANITVQVSPDSVLLSASQDIALQVYQQPMVINQTPQRVKIPKQWRTPATVPAM